VSISIERKEWTKIRIIVAFEADYYAYRGTLAASIRILCPDADVVAAELEGLDEVVERFGPDIVIGSPLKGADLDGVRAWIELSLNPAQLTKVNVDGNLSEMLNPTLDKLLVIIEEVAQLTQTSHPCDSQMPT
jgi:hypothetical protein